jgi:hypothetical protein
MLPCRLLATQEREEDMLTAKALYAAVVLGGGAITGTAEYLVEDRRMAPSAYDDLAPTPDVVCPKIEDALRLARIRGSMEWNATYALYHRTRGCEQRLDGKPADTVLGE